MNKSEFIALVAHKGGMTKKDADAAVDLVLGTIGDVLADEGRLALSGFGTFEVKERAARTGRSLTTGEPIALPAARAAVFKAGAQLKGKVNPK